MNAFNCRYLTLCMHVCIPLYVVSPQASSQSLDFSLYLRLHRYHLSLYLSFVYPTICLSSPLAMSASLYLSPSLSLSLTLSLSLSLSVTLHATRHQSHQLVVCLCPPHRTDILPMSEVSRILNYEGFAVIGATGEQSIV